MDCPIFEMCMNGRGPSQIANQLREDGILTPTAYKDSQGTVSYTHLDVYKRQDVQ